MMCRERLFGFVGSAAGVLLAAMVLKPGGNHE
jgi:hypothetical protein